SAEASGTSRRNSSTVRVWASHGNASGSRAHTPTLASLPLSPERAPTTSPSGATTVSPSGAGSGTSTGSSPPSLRVAGTSLETVNVSPPTVIVIGTSGRETTPGSKIV